MAGGDRGRGNIQTRAYHSGRSGDRARSLQLTPGEEVGVKTPKVGKAGLGQTLRSGKGTCLGSRHFKWHGLGCTTLLPDRGFRTCQGRSRVYLTRAIGSNDGGKSLKWSDNLSTLVRLKVLDLNQFQETHDGGGTNSRAVRGGTKVACAGSTAVQAGRISNLARVSQAQTRFPASGAGGGQGRGLQAGLEVLLIRCQGAL